MKRGVEIPDIILHEMPPTRGHDLKHPCLEWRRDRERMPPTRGHDLKLSGFRSWRHALMRCPPHGGTT